MNGAANVFTGDVQLSNTGTNTFGDASGDSFTFNGGIDSDDGTTVINAGTFATSDDQIDLGTTTVNNSVTIVSGSAAQNIGATTLADNVTLTLQNGGSGAVTVTSVSGTAGGTVSNLTVNNTGVNTIGAVGTDIGAVTVNQSGGMTFSSTVNAATLTLTDTTGTVAVQGNLTLTSGLATANQDYNVLITGSTNTIAGDTSFLNTGSVTIGDAAGDITTFTGGLGITGNVSNPSSVTVAGTINTSDTRMDIGAVTLAAATTLDTGNNAAGVLNVGVVTSAGNSLTLDSGSTAGATMSLTSMADISGGFTIRDAGGLATIGALGVGTAGNITVTDSTSGVTFSGVAEAAGNTILLSNTTAGQDITFQGNVEAATFTTTATSAYDVIIQEDITVTNDCTFGAVGMLTIGTGSD
ncbi:MAG: hypothetical protein GY841_04250, partial [FCB group bacterium]|nr:hypothetical protein [FCB group bacterium]